MFEFNRESGACWIPVHLAIAMEENKERILVGNEMEIFDRLTGREIEIHFDRSEYLGAFLNYYEEAQEQEWNRAVFDLTKALEETKVGLFKKTIKTAKGQKLEKQVRGYLMDQYATSNPIRKFLAVRLWQRYVGAEEGLKGDISARDRTMDEFWNEAQRLVNSVVRKGPTGELPEEKLQPGDSFYGYPKLKRPVDMMAMVCYPSDELEIECAYNYGSLLGLKAYYADRMRQKGVFVIECAVCRKLFLGTTIKTTICSEPCKKERARKLRGQRRSEATNLTLEQLSNRERNFWTRWTEKIVDDKFIKDEDKALAEKMMKSFRAEAKAEKAKHKAGSVTSRQIKDWYEKKHMELQKFCEELGLLE